MLFDIILNNFGLFTKNIKWVSVLRLAFSKIYAIIHLIKMVDIPNKLNWGVWNGDKKR